MNEPSATPALAPAPEAVALLEPDAVLAAVCEPVRRAILTVLADGRPYSVSDLAARLGRPLDGISKHLRVLRGARLLRLVSVPGTDGRCQFHELPTLFRSLDAAGRPVLDFGEVVLRLR